FLHPAGELQQRRVARRGAEPGHRAGEVADRRLERRRERAVGELEGAVLDAEPAQRCLELFSLALLFTLWPAARQGRKIHRSVLLDDDAALRRLHSHLAQLDAQRIEGDLQRIGLRELPAEEQPLRVAFVQLQGAYGGAALVRQAP